jgi:hypothetical protein
MENVPANAISLETILNIRNNIVQHAPEETNVLASLELRSV